eukprot:4105637-Prymnesium_polylepis.1
MSGPSTSGASRRTGGGKMPSTTEARSASVVRFYIFLLCMSREAVAPTRKGMGRVTCRCRISNFVFRKAAP